MSESQDYRVCDACGATIYPEHLRSQAAQTLGERLLCPHCVKDHAPAAPENEPIRIDDDPRPRVVGTRSTQIKTIGGAFDSGPLADENYRRPLSTDGKFAQRVKTFHCKLNDNSFRMLDRQINEWIDSDDQICVKFALSTIGVVEGKHADPHLIINVFY